MIEAGLVIAGASIGAVVMGLLIASRARDEDARQVTDEHRLRREVAVLSKKLNETRSATRHGSGGRSGSRTVRGA